MDSGLRKVRILSFLSHHKKIMVNEIFDKLIGEGEKVSVRTVQRDLNDLSRKFSITDNGERPPRWYFSEKSPFVLPNFDLTTSLIFLMVQKHLWNLLPQSMRDRLTLFFITAELNLKKENINSENQLPRKIYVHSKGLPLHPANISDDILESVFSAVFNEKCLKLTYQSFNTGNKEEYFFHPLGV